MLFILMITWASFSHRTSNHTACEKVEWMMLFGCVSFTEQYGLGEIKVLDGMDYLTWGSFCDKETS